MNTEAEKQNEVIRRHGELVERCQRGEITMEQSTEGLLDAWCEVFYPDDPEGAADHRRRYAALRKSPLGKAIEMAVELPGVDIPVGSADGPEAN